MPRRSCEIRLSVDVEDDDLAGVADDGIVPPRSFHGWLGLLATLDALLAAVPSAADVAGAPDEPPMPHGGGS
ncbi:hypothetical protein [Paraconexibacter algicola]|uniref:Uncharacterized protein n=1 Tax=Paraconexibacter algicola TaxID=2133960 RepID=A0A2T4UHQ5_9ACTN|nr:hypothetical protein [Paraconexibacter algicola]PTL58776.1 hypothetical protein C7Y72_03490 [Paraconexibacter algicola]